MEKTQVYLRKEEFDALRKASRKVVLKPQAAGPVAIWEGEPGRASIDHDSVYDKP